jgi:alkylation response protein AidB-like acyl-CoA dehydrogenase
MSQGYPMDIIKQKALDVIRENAARAEKDGKLTKAQFSLAIEQKWFKIYVATAYGGLQMQLPDSLELLEALACADGSFGWMVSNCVLAGWNSGFVDPEVAKEIFSGDKMCVCGNELSKGAAIKHSKGYKLSGIWQYTAGAADTTAFVADCARSSSENGGGHTDDCLSFVLLKDEIVVATDGNSMGLLAAENLDIELKDINVNEDRAFKRTGADAKVKGALYQFPHMQLAEAVIAVNLSGMATRFIELCTNLFSTSTSRDGVRLADDLTVQETLRKQSQKFSDARTKLYYAVELAWRAVVNGQSVKPAILYKVTSAAADLSRRARECVDSLYPYCGVQAADKRSDINRVWRDLHTASLYGVALSGVGTE